MSFLKSLKNTVKKFAAPVAAIALAPATGGASLALLGASSSGSFNIASTSGPQSIVNDSNWLGGAIEGYLQDRQSKRNIELEKARLETSERAKAGELNFVIQQAELARRSGQGVSLFNPFAGTLSNFPQSDAAGFSGPTRPFSPSGMPAWVWPVVIVIAGFFLLPLAIKR